MLNILLLYAAYESSAFRSQLWTKLAVFHNEVFLKTLKTNFEYEVVSL